MPKPSPEHTRIMRQMCDELSQAIPAALADGSAGLSIGHRCLEASEDESARGICFAAARRLIDAVEGDKQVGDDDSHAPILE